MSFDEFKDEVVKAAKHFMERDVQLDYKKRTDAYNRLFDAVNQYKRAEQAQAEFSRKLREILL